jgi:hypothetical protein
VKPFYLVASHGIQNLEMPFKRSSVLMLGI